MGSAVGTFRTPAEARAYYEQYDRFVAGHWPVPSSELDVTTSFGTTHVRRSGPAAGTPLVLLHPTSGSSIGWHRVIAPLCADRPVYTPDTIGTVGRSVQTAPIRTAADLSRWLDDTLDALQLDRVHLLGYSEGGWIAGTHAGMTTNQQRLASLTLIEPAGAINRMPRLALWALLGRAVKVMRARDKPAALRDLNRWLSGNVEMSDDEVELVLLAFQVFRAKLPRPGRLTDDQLRGLAVPVLLLLGEHSRVLDAGKAAKRATDLLPDVTAEITPGATHGLPFEHPEAITARVLDYITRRDTCSQPTSR